MNRPSAWLPIVMSFTVLTVFIVHVTLFGFVHETDEGTAAHIFQILMAGQVPIILFFAAKWLPKNPKFALQVLALQIGAALLPLAAVFFSNM